MGLAPLLYYWSLNYFSPILKFGVHVGSCARDPHVLFTVGSNSVNIEEESANNINIPTLHSEKPVRPARQPPVAF